MWLISFVLILSESLYVKIKVCKARLRWLVASYVEKRYLATWDKGTILYANTGPEKPGPSLFVHMFYINQ